MNYCYGYWMRWRVRFYYVHLCFFARFKPSYFYIIKSCYRDMNPVNIIITSKAVASSIINSHYLLFFLMWCPAYVWWPGWKIVVILQIDLILREDKTFSVPNIIFTVVFNTTLDPTTYPSKIPDIEEYHLRVTSGLM